LIKHHGIDFTIRDQDGKTPADYVPTRPSWLYSMLTNEKNPYRSSAPEVISFFSLFSFFIHSSYFLIIFLKKRNLIKEYCFGSHF